MKLISPCLSCASSQIRMAVSEPCAQVLPMLGLKAVKVPSKVASSSLAYIHLVARRGPHSMLLRNAFVEVPTFLCYPSSFLRLPYQFLTFALPLPTSALPLSYVCPTTFLCLPVHFLTFPLPHSYLCPSTAAACTPDAKGITYNEHINVAVAVTMPDGGLITPVIKVHSHPRS